MSHDLTLTRTIAAHPDKVWRCLTESALARQWFAPKPVVTTVYEMDLRPGGSFRTVMEVPDHGTMANDPGCVLVAEPGKRLVWTSALGPEFKPNAVPEGLWVFTADIRLTLTEGGCLYEVTASHATQEAADAHAAMGFEAGWGAAADQLAELAASL
jgi:uncharacterized protein YndB with AHSA1/START domain